MGRADRGHQVRPHTADVILEAWGPDLPACCEEAVAALVSVYADGTGSEEIGRRSLHLPRASDEDLLLEVLEEVIFTLDTADGVPVRAAVRAADDGGLDLEVLLVDRATVVATGAVPKAVSRSELAVSRDGGRVRGRFLVDV
jgi:SHS2 domain-containing protein